MIGFIDMYMFEENLRKLAEQGAAEQMRSFACNEGLLGIAACRSRVNQRRDGCTRTELFRAVQTDNNCKEQYA